jgi:hypothetical protein
MSNLKEIGPESLAIESDDEDDTSLPPARMTLTDFILI